MKKLETIRLSQFHWVGQELKVFGIRRSHFSQLFFVDRYMRIMRNIATLLLILVVGTASVWGANMKYKVLEGSWNTSGNWDLNRVPSSGDYVTIPNGAIVTITEGTYTIAALTVEAGGTLIVKGAVTLVFYQENQGNQKEAGKATISGTVIFENDFDGSGAVGTLKAQSNNDTKGNSLISLESGSSVSGAGNIEAKAVDIKDGADLSGYIPANRVGSTTYYIEGTDVNVQNGVACSSAYIIENNNKVTNQRVFYCATIIVKSNSTVTFHNSGNLKMNNLDIANGSAVSIDNANGKFNGSGVLTITGELSVTNSGETNTFAPDATGTIFTSGTVRVTNPNWGGVAPRFYIGTNSNWTADKNWSIDANRNIYYWNNNAYYYPGKSDNNGVAHIAAGKSVTLSEDLVYPIGITTYGSVTLNGNISLGSSNMLIAYPGSNVTVNSTITRTNADQIIVYHTYANSASFYKGSSGSIGVDNKLNVRHKIKGGRVYYMGASTEDGDYSMPAGTRESYDAATEEFTSGTPTSGTHRTGTVKLSAAGTISETGSVPFSDKTYTLKKAEGKFGWNLLCNPFTTGVSLSSLTAEDGAVEPTVWVRVKDGSSYGFVTYSISTGVSSPAGGSDIAPQQAFFVKAKYNEASFTVKYPSSGASGAQLKSASIVPDDVLRLTISSEGCNTDEVALVFRDGGALGLIRGDSEKRDESATYNALFAMKDGVQCVIPYYPEVGVIAGEELPLGFRLSSKSTKGIITATNLEEFGVANDIYLVDKQENVVVNLTEEGSYEFTAEAGKENTGRFAIVIGGKEQEENCDESIATGIENVRAENALVCNSEGIIVILASGGDATLRVYDSVGRLVKSETVRGEKTIVPVRDKGLYVAELITEEGIERAKMLMK